MCDGVVLVTDAVPLDGHRVAVRFSDGYSGVLDMAKYFGYPAFAGLNDPAVFATARAGLGTVLWGDGDIDVAPDTAREEAVPLGASAALMNPGCFCGRDFVYSNMFGGVPRLMKIPQECCVTLGVLLKTNGFISPLIVARGCPSSNPNRHKEIQWQKWLFTASHGARMLRESNPQITTVDQHMEMRGKVMADIVIKKIHGIDSPRTVMLPTELVVRQSA